MSVKRKRTGSLMASHDCSTCASINAPYQSGGDFSFILPNLQVGSDHQDANSFVAPPHSQATDYQYQGQFLPNMDFYQPDMSARFDKSQELLQINAIEDQDTSEWNAYVNGELAEIQTRYERLDKRFEDNNAHLERLNRHMEQMNKQLTSSTEKLMDQMVKLMEALTCFLRGVRLALDSLISQYDWDSTMQDVDLDALEANDVSLEDDDLKDGDYTPYARRKLRSGRSVM